MAGEKIAASVRVIPPRGVSVRSSPDTYAVNHPAVHRGMRFIKEHLARRIGFEEIAQASGLSIRALQEAFRQELHRGVHDELLLRRVQVARHLLTQTKLSIEEIAAQTGFKPRAPSPSDFSGAVWRPSASLPLEPSGLVIRRRSGQRGGFKPPKISTHWFESGPGHS